MEKLLKTIYSTTQPENQKDDYLWFSPDNNKLQACVNNKSISIGNDNSLCAIFGEICTSTFSLADYKNLLTKERIGDESKTLFMWLWNRGIDNSTLKVDDILLEHCKKNPQYVIISTSCAFMFTLDGGDYKIKTVDGVAPTFELKKGETIELSFIALGLDSSVIPPGMKDDTNIINLNALFNFKKTIYVTYTIYPAE